MDRLIEAIDNTQNPSVVGLDPTEALVPPQVVASFADEVRDSVESPEEVESAQLAVAYFEYNRTIIDAIADIVPAVKPQIAMYEALGPAGVDIYTMTCEYAAQQGLYVLGDIKRGDIGSTAAAYAHHLNGVGDFDPWHEDAVTVNPYLGTDGITPFVEAAAEADEHAGRAGAHQVQGSGVVGCAADDDRHVKVVDELLEVQRFLAGGDVLGGDHSAADHEQVHARVHHGGVELLGALRGERAGHGDTGGANLVQTLRDELRLDRLGIDLLDTLGGLIGRQSGDFVQQRGRILVTGPQTFQIEHAERAHLAHGDGGGRAGHRIHGGADHRHIELIGVDLPRGGDVLGVAGATGGDDCHIVECVAETAFFAQTDFNFLRHGFQPIARVGRQQGRFPRTGRLLQVVTNMRYD